MVLVAYLLPSIYRSGLTALWDTLKSPHEQMTSGSLFLAPCEKRVHLSPKVNPTTVAKSHKSLNGMTSAQFQIPFMRLLCRILSSKAHFSKSEIDLMWACSCELCFVGHEWLFIFPTLVVLSFCLKSAQHVCVNSSHQKSYWCQHYSYIQIFKALDDSTCFHQTVFPMLMYSEDQRKYTISSSYCSCSVWMCFQPSTHTASPIETHTVNFKGTDFFTSKCKDNVSFLFFKRYIVHVSSFKKLAINHVPMRSKAWVWI